jgi:signal transduction histidine kinase
MAASLASATELAEEDLRDGEVLRARTRIETEVLPVVSNLASSLDEQAATLRGRIESEQDRAGRLARLASFVVALVVPVLAVLMVRQGARRRLERQRLEAEVARQQDLAETQERMIAGLSHQLRTPITGIYGWSDLLRQDPGLVDEGALVILQQAGTLRRMVDDILVTTRIHSTELARRPAISNIDGIIDDAVGHFGRLGQSLRIDAEPAELFVDRARVVHALHNLVANAIQHGHGPIEIIGRKSVGQYRLAVVDRGKGLDPSLSRDPFAAFAHAPEDITTANSLGLGLFVAESLVRGEGGRLSYRRQEGCTIFAVSLPIAVEVVPATAGGDAPLNLAADDSRVLS